MVFEIDDVRGPIFDRKFMNTLKLFYLNAGLRKECFTIVNNKDLLPTPLPFSPKENDFCQIGRDRFKEHVNSKME